MSSKILYEIKNNVPVFVSNEGDLLDTDFDVSFDDVDGYVSLDRSNLRCVCCNAVSSRAIEDDYSPFTADSFYLSPETEEVLCFTCMSYGIEKTEED